MGWKQKTKIRKWKFKRSKNAAKILSKKQYKKLLITEGYQIKRMPALKAKGSDGEKKDPHQVTLSWNFKIPGIESPKTFHDQEYQKLEDNNKQQCQNSK